MIFRVCEHYYEDETNNISSSENNNSNYKNNINECVICFEIETSNELKPIFLKEQQIYIRKCNCNSSIHKECLNTWFQKNKNCPICRTKVLEIKPAILIIYDYAPYSVYMLFYIKQFIINFLKCCMIILFIHINLEFYILIIKNKYNTIDNTSYSLLNVSNILPSTSFNNTNKL